MFGLFSEKSKVTDLSWLGVDVHTHTLQGLDPVAPDLSSAKQLVQALETLGFQKLICTPVRLSAAHDEQANQTYLTLKAELAKLDCKIELLLAGEYILDQNFKAEGLINAINNRYVLVSSDSTSTGFYQRLSQQVFELIVRNYRPILAHPERNPYLMKDRSRLKRLRDKGCLFQLNLLSLTGYYGEEVKSGAKSLLKDKLYDLAGTDLQSIEELRELSNFIENGRLHNEIGKYPFKNKTLFSTIG